MSVSSSHQIKVCLFLSIILFIGFPNSEVAAQISPPGLDDTRIVLFGALGINQSIGKKWFNQSYIGVSRFSDPNNNSILKKQAIDVVEQQTYRQFGKHWQLAFCLSFRGQNMYSDQPPYDDDIPSLRREIRYYLRLFYRHQSGRFSFAYSLRPEWRNFYSPDWSNFYESPKALRYRAKAQAGLTLGNGKNNSIIISNEVLFVQVQQRQEQGDLRWTPVSFSEDRIATYYRHTFKKPSIILDLGMMQQLNFKNSSFVNDFVHFAFDVLFINPFGTGQKRGQTAN
jgi:hypothetical protein